MKAILFDLDDTLVVDEASNRDAMDATGRYAREAYGADAPKFVRAAEAAATKLFAAGPCFAYCDRIGISHHECLWGEFSGDLPETRSLREWSAGFRLAVFESALRAQLLEGEAETAIKIASVFARTRRKLQILLPDAVETLRRLKATHKLGLLTNGDSSLQREKFAASGLAPLLDAVIVSGEHGVGKPDPRIFGIALDALQVSAAETAMVGNSLARDVGGARNAGLAFAVWLEIPGAEEFAEVEPSATIHGLHELPGLFR